MGEVTGGGLVRDRLFVSVAAPNGLVCKLLFRGYHRLATPPESYEQQYEPFC